MERIFAVDKVRILIEGPGNSFGAITKVIETLFRDVGAEVEVVLDDTSASMSIEETKNAFNQVVGRKIIIETKSLPWGW